MASSAESADDSPPDADSSRSSADSAFRRRAAVPTSCESPAMRACRLATASRADCATWYSEVPDSTWAARAASAPW